MKEEGLLGERCSVGRVMWGEKVKDV